MFYSYQTNDCIFVFLVDWIWLKIQNILISYQVSLQDLSMVSYSWSQPWPLEPLFLLVNCPVIDRRVLEFSCSDRWYLRFFLLLLRVTPLLLVLRRISQLQFWRSWPPPLLPLPDQVGPPKNNTNLFLLRLDLHRSWWVCFSTFLGNSSLESWYDSYPFQSLGVF